MSKPNIFSGCTILEDMIASWEAQLASVRDIAREKLNGALIRTHQRTYAEMSADPSTADELRETEERLVEWIREHLQENIDRTRRLMECPDANV